MIFKDEYKKELENIRADDTVKDKILVSMNVKTEVKRRKSKVIIYRTAAAIAACFALVVSLWAVNFDNIPVNSNKTESGENISFDTQADSYGEIYKTVKKFVPEKQSAFGALIDEGVALFTDGVMNKSNTDAEAEIYEEYAVEDNTGVVTQASGSVTTETTTDDSAEDYSETTSQVEGVHEADVVKTDGKYIYSLSIDDSRFRIIKAGKEPKQLSSTYISRQNFDITEQMYLVDGKIVLLGNNYDDNGKTTSKVIVYDVSKPEKPEELFKCEQSGYVNDSRLIGDKLYLISEYSVNVGDIEEKKPATYVPEIICDNYSGAVESDCIYIGENVKSATYTVLCGYSMADGSLCSTQSLLGGTYAVYCNTKNIITASNLPNDTTAVSRFALDDGKIELKATGEINGTLLNQFSIDEHNEHFRFVTTISRGIETRQDKYVRYELKNSNSLYVLDSELKQVGAIENLAPDERVYSVRFMGDVAYFVTFRQVDPLFSADLSDPKNPKIIGKLKIPGFSTYMFPYGNGQLLGIGQEADENTGRTSGIKLSMFDISDPSNVTETAKAVLDVNYSDSLYNHKAIIADVKRNVIGFSVFAEKGSEYRMFTFENGEFKSLANIEIGGISSNIRGLYIGQEFYVVSDDYLWVYNMNDYSLITKLQLTV